MKLKLKKLFRVKQKDPHCSVVVVAAGNSERMGGDKMLMTLGAKPVIIRTLMAFQQCPMVDDIVVVTRREKIMALADMIKLYDISKVSQVISGGATRAESSLAGVSAVRKGAKLIAIHDGARPLVSRELIERVVREANEHISAVPVIPSTDTLKKIDENGVITGSVDRASVVRVQTPQVFDADLIRGALGKAAEEGAALTDDCSAVERLGIPVTLTRGSYENIKITTPVDLAIGEAILNWRDAR